MVLHQYIANLLLISITCSITACLFNTIFLSVISLFNISCRCLRVIEQKATWGMVFATYLLISFLTSFSLCLLVPCQKTYLWADSESCLACWFIIEQCWNKTVHWALSSFWMTSSCWFILKFLIFCKSAGHNYFKAPTIICIPLHHITSFSEIW